MATKVYCANDWCKFNKDDVCTAKEISLSFNSVMTYWDGRQQFNKCKTYEESEEIKKLMRNIHEIIAKMEEQ